jgi:hypothetical protein
LDVNGDQLSFVSLRQRDGLKRFFVQNHVMNATLKIIVTSTFILFRPLMADERTWTSSDAREIKAELVSYDVKTATIIIKNKSGQFTLPFVKLSQEDQTFIRELAEKEEEERGVAKRVSAERAGTTNKEVTEAGNSYHVYYPTSYSVAKKPSLLILFSPSGGGSGILKNFRQGADALGWVLVGCDKLKNGMSDEEGSEIFTDLLASIEKRVDHDPNLLCMGGMSGGGLRAYLNSVTFERPWKGIISCGGWLGGSENHGLEYPKKMAIAIVNGDGDKAANSHVAGDTQVLERRRCKVEYITFPGGHVTGPPEIIEEAMKWVEENSQKK